MFSRVATLLALLPMLLHSILGCCWHHAHHSVCHSGDSRVICQSSVESPVNAHRDHAAALSHNHEHGTGTPGESPLGPCPESPSGDERCFFASAPAGIVPQTVALEWGWLSIFVATVELPTPVGSPGAAHDELLGGRLPHSAGQCRALTQVWLI